MGENNNKNLKKKIMRRVFRSWLMKSIVPLFVIEFIVLVFAIYFFASLIYVSDVVDNVISASLGNPIHMAGYLWSSFLSTRIEVQLVIVLLIVGAFFLLKDLNRSIVSYLMVKRNQMLDK